MARAVQPRRLALAIAIWLVLSGCAGSLSPARDDLPTFSGAAKPKLKLKRVWGSKGHQLKSANYALFLDQTVIMSGIETKRGDGHGHHTVLVADARTGKVRWLIDDDTPLPRVVERTGLSKARPDVGYWKIEEHQGYGSTAIDTPGGGIVVVPYVQKHEGAPDGDPTKDWAIVGLSLADGRPRWAFRTTPRLPEIDPRSRLNPNVVDVTRDAVVISLYAPNIGFTDRHHTGKPAKTIALDPRTGAELWSRDNLLAKAARGDVVVATSRSGQPPATKTGDRSGIPVVLDTRTGAPRWTGRHISNNAGVCGRHAIFRPVDRKLPLTVVDLQDATAFDITADPGGRIVCDDDLLAWIASWDTATTRLLSRTVADEQVVRGSERVEPSIGRHTSHKLQVAVDGYLWSRSWQEVPGPDVWTAHAFDRTGSERASAPGRLVAVSESFLVVATSDQSSSDPYEVYKITRD